MVLSALLRCTGPAQFVNVTVAAEPFHCDITSAIRVMSAH